MTFKPSRHLSPLVGKVMRRLAQEDVEAEAVMSLISLMAERKHKLHQTDTDDVTIVQVAMVLSDWSQQFIIRLRECYIRHFPMDDGPHVAVEYDLNYRGGNYSGVGQVAYIPAFLVDTFGMPAAFTGVTGHNAIHIVHYSEDELVDKNGEPRPEPEDKE